MRLGVLQKQLYFFRIHAHGIARLLVFFLAALPATTDLLSVSLFSSSTYRRDFSSGQAVVPLEEIFPSSTSEPEVDVTRHALRIIEQHYVQREKLDVVRMLVSGIRALGREHGGDIEVTFLRSVAGERLQLSSHRTISLCPGSGQQSAQICPDSGVVSAATVGGERPDMQAVVRIGLRVFGIPISAGPGLKNLDLVGRFIVPEFARWKGISVSQAIHTYINGLLDELDPHSSYMTQDEYRELRSGTRGQFGGVGLVIDESQELPVIREVVPNSPAHMSGVRPGDVLLRVGQRMSAFHTLDQVLREVRELSVDSASPVWFFRPSSRRVYRAFLAREEIPTRSAEVRVVEGHPEILHVRVTGFSNHTAEDVYSLYEHSQLTSRGKIKVFVLDLRGNPGGLLDQAIQLSDLFIRHGRIVSTRSRFEEQVEQATRGVKIDLPLVVFVNSSSASASEIVAGALKDHGRALVVGERTFGKGSVQSLFELNTGTALKLTVAHYFTPQGQSLQGVGVEPHVNIKMVSPREGFFWMSGSSELDREEHLTSHLLNPAKAKSGVMNGACALSLNMWAKTTSEGNILDALRPINFSYPPGDNTQTLLRVDDDPVARVGIGLAQVLFAGRSVYYSFSEKQLRDAHKRVAAEELQRLKLAIETSAVADGLKTLPKNFFDPSVEERTPSSSAQQTLPTPMLLPYARQNQSNRSPVRGLRDIMRFLNIFAPSSERYSLAVSPKISLSASSLLAWQSDSQILLSIPSQDVKVGHRSGSPVGVVGLRLDDLHDGPSVWIPAHFAKANDKQYVAPIVLPKAVRTYLSSVQPAGEAPSVAVMLKWRVGDEPSPLGVLRLAAVAKRHGRLSGQLLTRNGRHFLQILFNRALDPLSRAESGSAVSSDVWASGQGRVEVLIASLSDDRVKVITEVVPLQKMAEGEYLGETELKLQPVLRRGLEFGGLIGGIVRGAGGDILASAPLLVLSDEGIEPIRDDELRATPTSPW